MRDKSVKKKVYLLLGSVLALALLTEILFAHPHHHRLWNVVPGADILIGFGGAWLLILLGKGFMNKLLRRPENYYAEQAAGNVEAKTAAFSPAAKRREKILKQKAGGRHE